MASSSPSGSPPPPPATHQLITASGDLLEPPLHAYLSSLPNGEDYLRWNDAYQVVAIMGPQSSGKSTLLNHVFGVRFDEMNADLGRSQTTKGVWLSRAASGGDDAAVPTLVMDLEGTDGRERGEDDTAFEKQTALFAMAAADVLLVNMWCNDIGREVASGKPLLKTIFQVNLKVFNPKKTTLLFVIRDKSRTPLEMLEANLREDLDRIWTAMKKPEKHADAAFDAFFTLKFVALSHYEHAHEKFVEDAEALRERFSLPPSDPRSLRPSGDDGRAAVPAAGLVVSWREAWRAVKENRDLDLPAHNVMVATVRCEEIARERLACVASDREIAHLSAAVASGPGPRGIAETLTGLTRSALEKYDEDAGYFDATVRNAKRRELASRLVLALRKIVAKHLTHWRDAIADAVPNDGDDGDDESGGAKTASGAAVDADVDESDADAAAAAATWSRVAAVATAELERELAAIVSAERKTRVDEDVRAIERVMERHVAADVSSLLDDAPADAWAKLEKILLAAAKKYVGVVSRTLAGFELDATELAALTTAMAKRVHETVDARVRDAASPTCVVESMKTAFSRGLPKTWRANDDVAAANARARREAVRVLGLLAVCRLPAWRGEKANLVTNDVAASDSRAGATDDDDDDGFPGEWPGAKDEDVMLSPAQCKRAWKKFESEIAYAVSQALNAVEAAARGGSPSAPAWMIALLIVCGFDEMMWLLRHPFSATLLLAVFLFGRALYNNLDVEAAMKMGVIPGLVFLSTKIIPTAIVVLKRLMDEGNNAPIAVADAAGKAKVETDPGGGGSPGERPEVRSIHWFPYDRVGEVDADP
ncbi:uncharacterized protein MICPUCDRAFT_23802 [Micromonas pusilla CCMP1545]|uniref:Predicted protein n=1 Tax=Micromonas pusilla (strain CCMP1545) TaxID=564608 RepID=C1N9P4_MICPC|nr:uncharacterized protein MICPUCDRAFT_23802 [Micromonas pusilla CCMP1545]EEH50984.1 predicted protein [Micromonas pusilla CCMP1545]|eukprot:XP_003064650.1 predicted protein [Micromonas pusilla CCMP1545]